MQVATGDGLPVTRLATPVWWHLVSAAATFRSAPASTCLDVAMSVAWGGHHGPGAACRNSTTALAATHCASR